MDESDCELQSIYDAYYPGIVRYLGRLVGENEAEDLAQEVFIKAGIALPGFRRQSSLSTWLYRIARNLAIDRLRSPSFRRCDDFGGEEAEEAHRSAGCAPEKPLTVEQRVVSHEMSACVWRFLDRLPEGYRAVLVLSDLEGLSDQEIAALLGLTLQAVKIRLHRARLRLRDELLDGCEYYWTSELSWQAL